MTYPSQISNGIDRSVEVKENGKNTLTHFNVQNSPAWASLFLGKFRVMSWLQRKRKCVPLAVI